MVYDLFVCLRSVCVFVSVFYTNAVRSRYEVAVQAQRRLDALYFAHTGHSRQSFQERNSLQASTTSVSSASPATSFTKVLTPVDTHVYAPCVRVLVCAFLCLCVPYTLPGAGSRGQLWSLLTCIDDLEQSTHVSSNPRGSTGRLAIFNC